MCCIVDATSITSHAGNQKSIWQYCHGAHLQCGERPLKGNSTANKWHSYWWGKAQPWCLTYYPEALQPSYCRWSPKAGRGPGCAWDSPVWLGACASVWAGSSLLLFGHWMCPPLPGGLPRSSLQGGLSDEEQGAVDTRPDHLCGVVSSTGSLTRKVLLQQLVMPASQNNGYFLHVSTPVFLYIGFRWLYLMRILLCQIGAVRSFYRDSHISAGNTIGIGSRLRP